MTGTQPAGLRPGRKAGTLAAVVVVNDRNLFQPALAQSTPPGGTAWVPRHHGLAAGLVAGAAGCGLPVTFLSTARDPAERELVPGPGVPVPAGSTPGVLRLAGVPPEQYRVFRDQFADGMMWLAHHDALGSRVECEAGLRAFGPYVTVNESLARLAAAEVNRESGQTCVLWQDYQLYLAPLMVRRGLPAAALRRYTSVHFVHVPFPRPDAWRFFPAHVMERLLTGLLGNDMVWFHVPAYAENFLAAVGRHVPGARAEGPRSVCWEGRRIFVGAHPLPPNVAYLRAVAADPRTARRRDEIRALAAGRRIVFSAGRVDPVKGYTGLLRSFAHLLERGHEDTMLLAQWFPSRTTIARWRAAATELGRLAADINGHYGHISPAPVHLSSEDDMVAAVAGYGEYDVLDATPDADGLNLVSLEGPAVNDRSGVLLLSSGAGSSHLYGDSAFTIPPASAPAQHAAALWAAVNTPPADRAARAARLRRTALAGDCRTWFTRLLTPGFPG
jgi:trehalose 6-phosphate synthase